MKTLLMALTLLLSFGLGCSDDNSGSTGGEGDLLGATEWPEFCDWGFSAGPVQILGPANPAEEVRCETADGAAELSSLCALGGSACINAYEANLGGECYWYGDSPGPKTDTSCLE